MKRLSSLFCVAIFALAFLCGNRVWSCDPATAAAFQAAAFTQTTTTTTVTPALVTSPVVTPVITNVVSPAFVPSFGYSSVGFHSFGGYGGGFNVNSRRFVHNNIGFSNFRLNVVTPFAGGFSGGSVNINARRIRNNNFGGALSAAAASGANVNINARRIRRNNF